MKVQEDHLSVTDNGESPNGYTRLQTMRFCLDPCNIIGLSSFCINVPKVDSGERGGVPKVELGEQRVNVTTNLIFSIKVPFYSY